MSIIFAVFDLKDCSNYYVFLAHILSFHNPKIGKINGKKPFYIGYIESVFDQKFYEIYSTNDYLTNFHISCLVSLKSLMWNCKKQEESLE